MCVGRTMRKNDKSEIFCSTRDKLIVNHPAVWGLISTKKRDATGLIIDLYLEKQVDMKKLLVLFSLSAGIALTGCKQGRYYDLTAGRYIEVEKDDQGRMVNSETHEPVYMYVDTKTHDTIYGATGKVINGYVVKTEDGKYKYEGDDEYKVKYGDYKKKVDGDEIKVKDGDTKIKTDGDEKKVKRDD